MYLRDKYLLIKNIEFDGDVRRRRFHLFFETISVNAHISLYVNEGFNEVFIGLIALSCKSK